MTLALIDCPTGLAGNMLLGALLDLGLPEAVIHAPLEALGLAGLYRLEPKESRSGGLRGLELQVRALEPQPRHRRWGELERQLGEAPLAEPLRRRVLAVFSLLAEAEAAVHGQPVDQVHFHEVGAIDALVDIVGVCAGLLHLGIEQLVCAVPPAGHGRVLTAHGSLPLPAPAVLEIARRRGIPLASSEGFPAAELTTPTGLALMACWAQRFGPAPAALPLQVGVGLGSHRLDRPNLLRLILAEPLEAAVSAGSVSPESVSAEDVAAERQELVVQQQAQIDDATPEDLAFLAEALRQAGALEVFSQAIAMKKGRHGFLLTALVEPDRAAALRQVWWRHSSTLGLRELLQPRWCLGRQSLELATPLGPLRLKRTLLPGGGERCKPEHDDLVALARGHDLSLAEVRRAVDAAVQAQGRPARGGPEQGLAEAGMAAPVDQGGALLAPWPQDQGAEAQDSGDQVQEVQDHKARVSQAQVRRNQVNQAQMAEVQGIRDQGIRDQDNKVQGSKDRSGFDPARQARPSQDSAGQPPTMPEQDRDDRSGGPPR